MYASCSRAIRSYSARDIVVPLVEAGSSVTMNVLPTLREVARVCTLTFSNSVRRHCGISSVYFRRSSAEGLSKRARA
jgi:hypothetical protein